jgi:pimeloyl-ACP methyl ester carboxylesterase
MRLLAAALLACLFSPACVQGQVPAALTADPVVNKVHPAAFETFQLPSHGALLNAFIYIAAGAGPHPTVLLLHGFPGNEKNLDLAQAMRRAGYDVLFFNYRGSWGSPGEFSFTHSIEDVQAAIAYLRDPANAARLRVDPQRLILVGHSMGGFMARYAGAQDLGIKAVGLISAADMAVDKVETIAAADRNRAIDPIAKSFAEEGLAPLAGCTAKSLAEEVVANADTWNTPHLGPKLAGRPVLVVTSEDGLQPSNDAFVAALKKAGATRVTTQHFVTDHAYSDRRIALETSVLNWLATL